MLLVEEALIDHLERRDHGDAAGERKEQSGHDWHHGMRRRIAEQGLDDVGAPTVETDVAAQIVIDSRIRQRTQNDDERRTMMNGSADHSSSAPKIVVQSKKWSAFSYVTMPSIHDRSYRARTAPTRRRARVLAVGLPRRAGGGSRGGAWRGRVSLAAHNDAGTCQGRLVTALAVTSSTIRALAVNTGDRVLDGRNCLQRREVLALSGPVRNLLS